MKTPEEIYQDCPVLKQIKKRLIESEAIAAAENEKRSKKPVPSGMRAWKQVPAQHFRVTHVLSKGSWEKVAFLPQPGSAFEETLMEIETQYEPDALKIEIYGGSKITKNGNEDKHTCYLKKGLEKTEEKEEGKEKEKTDALAGTIDEIKNQLASLTKSGEGISSSDSGAMALKFKDLEHTYAMSQKELKHERELDKKDQIIADLTDEINDLRQEILDHDAEIGNAADLLEKKIAPKPIETLLTAAIEKAALGIVKTYPKLLTVGFGLNAQQIAEIMADGQRNIDSGTAGDASFSEASGEEEYKGFDPKHAEALKTIHAFCKSLSFSEYQVLYTLLTFLVSDESKLIMSRLTDLIYFTGKILEREKEEAGKTEAV
jgi:hypothetical protein